MRVCAKEDVRPLHDVVLKRQQTPAGRSVINDMRDCAAGNACRVCTAHAQPTETSMVSTYATSTLHAPSPDRSHAQSRSSKVQADPDSYEGIVSVRRQGNVKATRYFAASRDKLFDECNDVGQLLLLALPPALVGDITSRSSRPRCPITSSSIMRGHPLPMP